MFKFKNKKFEKTDKFWLVDYSFFIYNYSFAKRPCPICGYKKIPDPTCTTCEGVGKVFLKNNKGEVIGGLYGVFNQIIERSNQGWKVILVFDPPKYKLDRSQLIDDYKGNRAPKPQFITDQMDIGFELFPLTNNIECYTSDTDESDDVLATIALELAEMGHEVVVASDDKDMFPLLANDKITLFRQKEFMNKSGFGKYMKKKYDITFTDPGRFSEFLAITGDAADNYNLIKGLGPKAAEFFLTKYKNVLDLWDDWKNIPDKYKKKLISSCEGNTCKKCTKCSLNNKETVKLIDTLETSLKLAYLNMESKYYRLENKNDFSAFHIRLTDLGLYNALKNINNFFG